MKYKAVIFDLDGTLLNTLEDISDAMNTVLASYHFPIHSYTDYKSFIGEGIRELVIQALPECKRISKIIDEGLILLRKEYEMRWDHKTILYPGISDLLNYLTEKNTVLGILSNKPHDLTVKSINKYFSKWNFSEIFGAFPSQPKKPDPQAAIKMSKDFQIPADQILFAGDTEIDMQTAKSAGMKAVGVLWGFRGKKELLASGADYLISKPIQLQDILNSG